MPGISLILSSNGLVSEEKQRFSLAMAKMVHYPHYRSETVFDDGRLLLGYTSYSGYPLTHFDTGRCLIAVEGIFYDKPEAETNESLRTISNSTDDEAALEEALRIFCGSTDGEYVVVIYNKTTSRLHAFTDPLGRLPLYWRGNNDGLLITREVKFLLPFLADRRLDRNGVMEYMLFGSPLGSSTLLDGVGSVEARSILAAGGRKNLTMRRYPQAHTKATLAGEDPSTLSERIASCFLESLQNRVNACRGRRPLVSLSGGLDSRAVLAGLCRLGAKPLAVTASGPEEGHSRAVAQRFGVEIVVLGKSRKTTEADRDRFVSLKDGLDCHPDLPQLYIFMEDLIRNFGPDIVYFTGIMGGEITRHYNPTIGLSSTIKVARHVLSTKAAYKYSTSKVALLLGMPKAQIAEHFVRMIDALQEVAPERKYIAFRQEIYRRYTGEAEDRNRFYCWTVSPFCSQPFTELMMSVDERFKGIRLWRDVLQRLDGRACKDPYFNRRLPLENDLAIRMMGLGERVVRVAALKSLAQWALHQKSRIRSRLRGRGGASPVREDLLHLLSRPGWSDTFRQRATAMLETEDDVLGIERMEILFRYVFSAGLVGSFS